MSSILDALDALAEAHGSAALGAAFRSLQRQVRQIRRASSRSESAFTNAVMEAVDLRAQLKADGATGTDLEAGLEAVVRATWPRSPGAHAWKYLCETCRDTGLEMRWCEGRGCGLAHGNTHAPHEVGWPCFCSKGERFRETKPAQLDAISAAAKTAKAAKPSRFGGR